MKLRIRRKTEGKPLRTTDLVEKVTVAAGPKDGPVPRPGEMIRLRPPIVDRKWPFSNKLTMQVFEGRDHFSFIAFSRPSLTTSLKENELPPCTPSSSYSTRFDLGDTRGTATDLSSTGYAPGRPLSDDCRSGIVCRARSHDHSKDRVQVDCHGPGQLQGRGPYEGLR